MHRQQHHTIDWIYVDVGVGLYIYLYEHIHYKLRYILFFIKAGTTWTLNQPEAKSAYDTAKTKP